jgi:hypothetical protein
VKKQYHYSKKHHCNTKNLHTNTVKHHKYVIKVTILPLNKQRFAPEKENNMAKIQNNTKKRKSVKHTHGHSAKKSAAVAKKEKANTTMKELLIEAFPPNEVRDIKTAVTDNMDEFKRLADNNLTNDQRKRKVGAGVRNYGFIDKVSDIASDNPEFVQFFNIKDLKNSIRNIEDCRDIIISLNHFIRLVSNAMMIYSDDAYSMSLIFYNLVKEMSRHGEANAVGIYKELQIYFKRPRHRSGGQTENELDRGVHAIIRDTEEEAVFAESKKTKAIGGSKRAGKRKKN